MPAFRAVWHCGHSPVAVPNGPNNGVPNGTGNRAGFCWETKQEHAGKPGRTIALFAVTPCRQGRDNRPARKGLGGDQLYVLKHIENQQQAFHVLLLYLMVGMGGRDSQEYGKVAALADVRFGKDGLNLVSVGSGDSFDIDDIAFIEKG